MKAFRRPLVWLVLWLAMVGAVVVASLGPAPAGPDVPQGDKWMHVGTYLLLAAGAVQVFRRGSPLVLACGATILVGVGLEVAQGTVTADRVMDVRDAVANTLGVALGAATCLLPGRDALLVAQGRPAE